MGIHGVGFLWEVYSLISYLMSFQGSRRRWRFSVQDFAILLQLLQGEVLHKTAYFASQEFFK